MTVNLSRREARDLGAIVTWARDLESEWAAQANKVVEPWFRGHKDIDWFLTPGLYRQGRHDDVVEDEDSMFALFQQRLLAHENSGRAGNHWDCYFLAQHYGVPTRLLDWTRGSMIATYFALAEDFERPEFTYERVQAMSDLRVSEFCADAGRPSPIKPRPAPTSRESDLRRQLVKDLKPGVIWALRPESLGEAFFSEPAVYTTDHVFFGRWLPAGVTRGVPRHFRYGKRRRSNAGPIAIFPPLIDRRMVAQRAAFTCHGASTSTLEGFAKTHPKIDLARITIPADWKVVLWHQLWMAGLSRDVIFPELQSAASVVTRENWAQPSKKAVSKKPTKKAGRVKRR